MKRLSVKKTTFIAICILLVLSVAGNVLQFLYSKQSDWIVVDFPNANSRETYFSVHNIPDAHLVSRGAGIKVGILDWGFGYSRHEGLYSGGVDFTGNAENFNTTSEHGYWMATALREVAPDCEIYALGTYIPGNEGEWVDALVKGIDWAIENDLDVLSLSHQEISGENRSRLDEAVDRAIANNLVTTFLHYDHPSNLLPYGFYEEGAYAREPDINIFHYDYNTLFVTQYLQNRDLDIADREYIPYYSFSSMSPVTAGFVAILKGVNNTLAAAEYKQILIDTSYSRLYTEAGSVEDETVKRVADINKAVAYLQEIY